MVLKIVCSSWEKSWYYPWIRLRHRGNRGKCGFQYHSLLPGASGNDVRICNFNRQRPMCGGGGLQTGTLLYKEVACCYILPDDCDQSGNYRSVADYSGCLWNFAGDHPVCGKDFDLSRILLLYHLALVLFTAQYTAQYTACLQRCTFLHVAVHLFHVGISNRIQLAALHQAGDGCFWCLGGHDNRLAGTCGLLRCKVFEGKMDE